MSKNPAFSIFWLLDTSPLGFFSQKYSWVFCLGKITSSSPFQRRGKACKLVSSSLKGAYRILSSFECNRLSISLLFEFASKSKNKEIKRSSHSWPVVCFFFLDFSSGALAVGQNAARRVFEKKEDTQGFRGKIFILFGIR